MFFYSLGIKIFGWSIHIASIFHPKAAAWIHGRKHWKKNEKLNFLKGCIWMHCASLGEFEQGRPVLEMLKQKFPNQKIILTFFSPSGYAVRKNYELADYVTYLPLDTRKNAKFWLELVQPCLAIFVKYDLWANFLKQAYQQKIPLFLISATFRSNQWIFQPWSFGFKNILKNFTHIFVQDSISAELLKKFNINNISITGDTRIDRVIELRKINFSDKKIENFLQQFPSVIAGSTWELDEKLLADAIIKLPSQFRFIIVPHDIQEKHIKKIEHIMPIATARYTDSKISSDIRILIVNKIGILNKIYRYASYTYVGGGFGKGVHNLLEPAVYNKPVFFGPKHSKFPEAEWLKDAGLGYVVKTGFELASRIQSLPATNSSEIPSCILQRSGGTTLVVHHLIKFLTP